MKIAVVGAGAMGSIYAGLMADADNEVWCVDLWQDHVDAINTRGLRVEGVSGDRTVTSIKATTNADEIGPCDLIIVATKASGVKPAAEQLGSAMGPETTVLSIQNGLGAGELIKQYLNSDNIMIGMAQGFGASMKGPGHTHHNGMDLIRIGEMSGGLTDRLSSVVELWNQSGFQAKGFADINQLAWEKFICNVAFSGPCTVFDRTLGEMMADPQSWAICKACATEAYEAGRAKGIALSFDDPIDYVTKFGEKMPAARPSMLLDHHASRRSEIDFINGMVPVVAKEVGTAAPYNEVVSAIVKSKEAKF